MFCSGSRIGEVGRTSIRQICMRCCHFKTGTCGLVRAQPSGPTLAGVSSYGLKVLDREECEALLRTQRVGRVGVCTHRPLVLPVVYALLDADVVFRTAPGEKLIAAALNRTVAFEIDEYDVSARSGWSVIVVGAAEEVVAPEDLKRVRALGLQPWAGDVRDRFVRIRTEEVSGRRVDPDA